MPPEPPDPGPAPEIRDLLPARLLHEVQEAFSDLAGFPVLVVSPDLRPPSPEAGGPRFCRTLGGVAPDACEACRRGAAAASAVVPGPRRCPAGPSFVLVPLEKDEVRFGALWLGPVLLSPGDRSDALRFAAGRGIPAEVLEPALSALPSVPPERLAGVSRLMGGFARALAETLQGALSTRWREDLLERRFRSLEEKVLEGKGFLESILTGARACIIASDLEGRVVFWPPYDMEYFGHAESDALGRLRTADLLAEPSRMGEILAAVRDGGFFEGEVVLARKDGTQSVNRLVVTPRRDRAGLPIGHVWVAADVTVHKEMERRLRISEARTRSVLETLPDAFYQTDEAGHFTYINDSGARVLGFAPEVLVGKDIARDLYVDPADRQELLRRLREGGGQVSDFVTRLWRGDGRQIWISAHSRFRRDEDGRVIGVEGVVRDVTDRIEAEKRSLAQMEELERAFDQLKQAQTRLVHSEKMAALGTLMASVAHEINNPVNFVHGNLDFIERTFRVLHEGRSLPLPNAEAIADLMEALADAKKGAARVKEIVETLRNVSRAGTRACREPVFLARSLEDALRLVEPSLRGRVAVTRRLDPGLCVRCDAGQFGQVWLNLLLNASQAIPGKGEIEVEAVRDGPDAVVRIRDTGPGIPPEAQDRLFEPFFTSKADGIGLGLSLSADIVRGHGGEIGFRTEPGRGTTFEVRLPALPPETCAEAAAPAPGPEGAAGPDRGRGGR
ncbi:MAG: PAS domain S-box protein [Planctomycetes bacterium]|jgi:PAS domain S-box-containing protein|nr:PAS domain S-box protein [Planctomycetota bacterium]